MIIEFENFGNKNVYTIKFPDYSAAYLHVLDHTLRTLLFAGTKFSEISGLSNFR